MSKAQERVYKAIKQFIEENGYSPSLREICELANLNSVATVSAHLENLRDLGYITYENNKSRTIRIGRIV